ncbi:MAG TPA: SGNH/GDSL hydrolase family protein [Abditibacteriaceae bacterium]|nr:SGNH/GDSL hydrolase family protein [Abditibacteriaceae bacterium]
MSSKEQTDVEKYDENMRPGGPGEEPLTWHAPDESPFELAGFAWHGSDRIYRRLPLNPNHKLSEAVDTLANYTAGGQIRFQTDSSRLSIRVQLAGPSGMVHMPATGQSGFDCYIGPPGHQRYYRTTTFDPTQDSYECQLLAAPTVETRNITLNFPLYQGVKEVMIGLEPDAAVLPPLPYRTDKRVIVYGTSITQGGCACRPGMATSNILSRYLNVEFINLGFSGSGKGEPEMARNMAEIARPGCFVLDYEGNAGAAGVRQTFAEFIRILREAHPAVPILAVSAIRYAHETVDPAAPQKRMETRDFQRQTIETLREQGDKNLCFFDGGELLGSDYDECTVDGVHPTDLGFMRMANGLAPTLEEILFATSNNS